MNWSAMEWILCTIVCLNVSKGENILSWQNLKKSTKNIFDIPPPIGKDSADIHVKVRRLHNICQKNCVKEAEEYWKFVETSKEGAKTVIYPAVVAEWVYKRLKIQVAESHGSQVPILLGAMKKVIAMECVMVLPK